MKIATLIFILGQVFVLTCLTFKPYLLLQIKPQSNKVCGTVEQTCEINRLDATFQEWN